MDKTLLLSAADKQIRAALLEGHELIEFFIDQDSSPSVVGNIYRGIIEDIVPGLEAAFVNIGQDRNAFLHFADIVPAALEIGKRRKSITAQVQAQLKAAAAAAQSQTGAATETSAAASHQPPRGRKSGHPRHNGQQPEWTKILQRGMPLMVQVMKDGFGDKAPRLTCNISLPGRLLVLLPFPTQSGGISKKIASPQERQRLKRILKALGSQNYSYIIRTAGMTATDDELENDAQELKRQWQTILRRYRACKSATSGRLLYDDQNLYIRLARDVLTPDVTRIVVDDAQAAQAMKDALQYTFPDKAGLVEVYSDAEPLFDRWDVTRMIRRAVAPKVWLKKGGQIVIDETEALTTIDVNSGRFISKENQEKTILETNLEACKTIAQHIRLRDLSGIIIIDFIDMIQESSRARVEAELRRWLRRDRAKMAIGGFSDFGIFLITRKRRRNSLLQQMTQPCPYCEGSGRLMHKIEIWRNVKQAVRQTAPQLQKRRDGAALAIMVHPWMADYIRERFEDVLDQWKAEWGVQDVLLLPVPEMHLEEYNVQVIDKRQSTRMPVHLRPRPRRETPGPQSHGADQPPPAGAPAPSTAAPQPSAGRSAGDAQPSDVRKSESDAPASPSPVRAAEQAGPSRRQTRLRREQSRAQNAPRQTAPATPAPPRPAPATSETEATAPTAEPLEPELEDAWDAAVSELEAIESLRNETPPAGAEHAPDAGQAAPATHAPTQAPLPEASAEPTPVQDAPEPAQPDEHQPGAAVATTAAPTRKRRRGRRGGRGRRKSKSGAAAVAVTGPNPPAAPSESSAASTQDFPPASAVEAAPASPAAPAETATTAPDATDAAAVPPTADPAPAPAAVAGQSPRGRRGGRRSGRRRTSSAAQSARKPEPSGGEDSTTGTNG
ncbi:MAG: hypothetical protein Kow0059_13870 [Candidatus Sumerlaeia bacterium]